MLLINTFFREYKSYRSVLKYSKHFLNFKSGVKSHYFVNNVDMNRLLVELEIC
jgi:hypothetical protein